MCLAPFILATQGGSIKSNLSTLQGDKETKPKSSLNKKVPLVIQPQKKGMWRKVTRNFRMEVLSQLSLFLDWKFSARMGKQSWTQVPKETHPWLPSK